MRFFDRLAKGEARWCGVTLPTDAQAQEAGMALADYEDFVYGAGHLDDDDPIAAWHEVSRRQQAVIDRLAPVRELRIVAEGTDLTVDVAGRAWQNADGRENFPDGEIYTSPDEAKTQGHIHFTIDAGYNGHEVVSGLEHDLDRPGEDVGLEVRVLLELRGELGRQGRVVRREPLEVRR